MNWFSSMFKKKKNIKLGLYGPPNGGKTTLANRICMDWLGEEMGSVSNIEHETREVNVKEKIQIKSKGKTFLIKRALVNENDLLFGLEKIVVSPKIAPFIGILYHTGAYSWGLELYGFDGKTIRKI